MPTRRAATPRYWFQAKRYGWGWGLPTCWQGYVVLVTFIALMVVNSFVFSPPAHSVAFVLGTAFLCSLLLAVCWAKGEPPRWRWGK